MNERTNERFNERTNLQGQCKQVYAIQTKQDGFGCPHPSSASHRKEKHRKDYAFRRHFNEKPSIILGCLGAPVKL